jgi:hypothetical protein
MNFVRVAAGGVRRRRSGEQEEKFVMGVFVESDATKMNG